MIEPNNNSIRLAHASDALSLARMRYALRASTGKAIETEVDFVQRCLPWMAQHLEADAWRCWVAEREGKMIGNLWLQRIEKIPNPTSESEYYAYITSFFVTESARGKGIGSSLLSTSLTWCREHEVQAVILWPTDKSRTLYERFGFAVRSDLFELVFG